MGAAVIARSCPECGFGNCLSAEHQQALSLAGPETDVDLDDLHTRDTLPDGFREVQILPPPAPYSKAPYVAAAKMVFSGQTIEAGDAIYLDAQTGRARLVHPAPAPSVGRAGQDRFEAGVRATVIGAALVLAAVIAAILFLVHP